MWDLVPPSLHAHEKIESLLFLEPPPPPSRSRQGSSIPCSVKASVQVENSGICLTQVSAKASLPLVLRAFLDWWYFMLPSHT